VSVSSQAAAAALTGNCFRPTSSHSSSSSSAVRLYSSFPVCAVLFGGGHRLLVSCTRCEQPPRFSSPFSLSLSLSLSRRHCKQHPLLSSSRNRHFTTIQRQPSTSDTHRILNPHLLVGRMRIPYKSKLILDCLPLPFTIQPNPFEHFLISNCTVANLLQSSVHFAVTHQTAQVVSAPNSDHVCLSSRLRLRRPKLKLDRFAVIKVNEATVFARLFLSYALSLLCALLCSLSLSLSSTVYCRAPNRLFFKLHFRSQCTSLPSSVLPPLSPPSSGHFSNNFPHSFGLIRLQVSRLLTGRDHNWLINFSSRSLLKVRRTLKKELRRNHSSVIAIRIPFRYFRPTHVLH
jgi:hypothetical protein